MCRLRYRTERRCYQACPMCPKAQSFEIQTNGCHVAKKHLKSGQKCPDFECLARPFEKGTISNLTFKKSRFKMVGFQIPTVYTIIQKIIETQL